MSLVLRLTALAQAVGADVKTLIAAQGNLATLSTTAKTNLVAAINELVVAIGAGAEILDTAGAGDTAHTWSADKIIAALDTAKAAVKSDLLGSADAAHDTLGELMTALGDADTALAGLLTAVGNRVRFDAAQALTAPQQAQACANIGVGDPETDLATVYTLARGS